MKIVKINEDKIKNEINRYVKEKNNLNIDVTLQIDEVVEHFIELFIEKVDDVIIDNIKDVLNEMKIIGVKE